MDNRISRIKEYYNKSQKWYNFLYTDKKSLGMHYGLWGENTYSHSEALINQYRYISKLLKPKKWDKILDAGCGIGGASFWLAENFDVFMTGITISEEQLRQANKILNEKKISNKVEFRLMDYFNTSFEDGYFDKIFGIESFCYSYPFPEEVYKEMYRILKKGGKLVFSDGVMLRSPKTEQEEKWVSDFLKGFSLEALCTPEKLTLALRKSGFENIVGRDFTVEIAKSVERIYLTALVSMPLYVLRLLGFFSQTEANNYLAMFSQKKMYKCGILGYYIFSADKN